jgi:hypothetical protein
MKALYADLCLSIQVEATLKYVVCFLAMSTLANHDSSLLVAILKCSSRQLVNIHLKIRYCCWAAEHFLGGLTVYCFGDPAKMSDQSVRLSLRIHDEVRGRSCRLDAPQSWNMY